MSQVKVLDCTLRDGGYCNNWCFGLDNIKSILSGLSEAKLDFAECGYLSKKQPYEQGRSIFGSLDDLRTLLPPKSMKTTYVAMINYGEFSLDDVPVFSDGYVEGLRIAFHKKDMEAAIAFCQSVKKKGYKLFVQPMVSLSYTDDEFLRLIDAVNQIQPFAFYIVDSFGIMKRKDLIRLFYMVEHNLNEGIAIGYHSHNNMQLAYSNAQTLADINTNRTLILDSSVYGMGRGAGNLNTELFVEYINDIHGSHYSVKPLLKIIDTILADFYQQNRWGYSLPNYLSAKHNAHPNYAAFLSEKNTLTYEAIDEIFALMDEEKRNHFDKEYIELLYTKFLESGNTQESNLTELLVQLQGKEILLIAPGRSSLDEQDIIEVFIKQNKPITISINFDYTGYPSDYIFISNLRRYSSLKMNRIGKSIVTSNIPSVDSYAKIRYANLLNNQESVQDNAGLMLVKFLIQAKAKKIYLAGMDGYSVDSSSNYADGNLTMYTKKAHAEAMNVGMSKVLSTFSREIPIEFLTKPKFVFIKQEY